MTLIHRVGIRDARIFAAAAPGAAPPSRLVPRFSDPSFRYHVPERIHSRRFTTVRTTAGDVSKAVLSPRCSSAIAEESIWTRREPLKPSTTSSLLIQQRRFSSRWNTRPTLRDSDGLPLTTRLSRRQLHHTPYRNDLRPEERNQKRGDYSSGSKKQDSDHGGENFYDRLQMPNFHRPSKEELLAAATGFWSRMKVRFKWATIRSMRPFNVDEIVGFFSWIALGHILWLVIGTTTFISLAVFAINTVVAQETLAGWVGGYLTKSSGLKVVFEEAIVPKWGDGVITFKNVFVSRRPGQDEKSTVRKGSPEAAAIAAARKDIPPEDQNYTQFDITLGEVNVTLSFSKWWNSKGLLQDVEIKHVRGVVDRTHVFWSDEKVDPKTYRHEHNPGDFEIESFKIDDLLITLQQPKDFRPFTISIYNADLPRLRKQWIMYDFLCANSMTGEFDHSLFTIHPRQTHSHTGADMNEIDSGEPWKKQSRIRLDGLNIDHLNRGVEGPFGWIREGNVDIVADMMIPNDNDESVIKVMSDFYDQIEAQFLVKKRHLQNLLENNTTYGEMEDDAPHAPVPVISTEADAAPSGDRRYLVMDLRVHLNDVRAQVPLFTKDLSYVNNALIRPIVAYINSRRTFIPIHCRVVKRVNDFDGSWTIYDSGLMDDLSAETYDAFSRDVSDEQARMRRIKKVGLWSLQLAVQAIFLGMAGTIA
ncbi:Mitochondrial distribution and morphology protein 31, mitochondrial precursor [Knufia fluminis]|uniref:Mitochondrial distribution and morphology protein 31, mitochondrial n=2 Tax=Knufia TaxID=430999 RepID=A0AAN8ILM3_9EURO|nr:Mitochondrial distribution and morphology protein 31, mitochondrial precursor [Knufia fluminis]